MKFNYEDIFLTGSSGWLGKQVIDSLINNDPDVLVLEKTDKLNINCFMHESEDASFLKKYDNHTSIFKGNLKRDEDIKNFLYKAEDSLLIHTAGVIHPKKIEEFYEVNLESTKKLVEEAERKNIKKIIVISSNSPLGCNESNSELFDESSQYNPYMNYGKSKEKMEIYLKEKINSGLDITILRPPWFYGSNMPERQMRFYQMIINGRFPIIGDGTNVRSQANVKNITQAILLASIKEISKGKIYWIADKENLNMNEIINVIKTVFEQEFSIKTKKNLPKIPFFVGQIFEYLDRNLQSMKIYSQAIHVLSEMNKNIACDISLAIKELDYDPKVNLYKGTAEAYQQHLDGKS